MQVIKGTWRMRKQCVPGSLSSSPAQEPGNESRYPWVTVLNISKMESMLYIQREESRCNVCLVVWDPGSSELSYRVVVLLYGVFRK